ncbi:hypothetical protein [Plantactinospora endophytica]|uniref:FXSXX-COOH protein n=1 Tax=Plantactinospora endophytica TaxID=673535 RepID=A0ABQ4E1J4_9ACTN|nr:hypothetical protein [Plantactinospora endophytica]GIG88541.1 hypothetical protein Pen02_34770 [Plantactinospora endophytica]
MDEPTARPPRDGLVDTTGRSLAELLASTPNSALKTVLRQLLQDEMAQPEKQTVSPFNSAL